MRLPAPTGAPAPSAAPAQNAVIVIPTRLRHDYLEVALCSIAPQAAQAGAELLVVSDGADPRADDLSARHGATFLALPAPRGANAARNAAVQATTGDPIVFVDDDVDAPAGWLASLLRGMAAAPEHDVFGGPIRARLEGGGPRACGRESAPITTLDLGPYDCDTALVWSANMAIRRRAFERVGTFDESIHGRGEEEEWQLRHAGAGGRTRYVATAGLDHRRTGTDARVRPLAHAAYRLGRSARRNDVRKGSAPPVIDEVMTLTGCVWHIFRRRCAIGFVMLAESIGRLREALAEIGP